MIVRRRHRLEAMAGFTLLEALVAMALMGMILMALATVAGEWLPNWKHGFARLQGDEQVAIAIDRLALDLSAAEFVSANGHTRLPLFEGTSRSVTLVRTTLGPNSVPGLDIVRISEEKSVEGIILVRTRAPFFPIEDSYRQLKFGNPVVLLRPPYRISFSYAGADRIWQNDWRLLPRLPEAIKLTLNDATDRRTLATAMLVHSQLPVDCLSAGSVHDCFAKLGASDGSRNGGIPNE
jgi:general secretion pathway protein J